MSDPHLLLAKNFSLTNQYFPMEIGLLLNSSNLQLTTVSCKSERNQNFWKDLEKKKITTAIRSSQLQNSM